LSGARLGDQGWSATVTKTRSLLLALAALATTAQAAHATDFSMVCKDDGQFVYQNTATNGKAGVNNDSKGGLGIMEPCPTVLSLTGSQILKGGGVLTGYEDCGARGRFEKTFQIVIDHATAFMNGEVIAVEKMGEVEAHLWAISFNRKEVAIVTAFTSDRYTEGGSNYLHCQ
jgi:hypothetical protein